MEEMLCAMALKSTDGRQNHHTLSGLRVAVLCAGAEKHRRTEYTRGGAVRGAETFGLRETACTGGGFGS
jgi:hypothetical protein